MIYSKYLSNHLKIDLYNKMFIKIKFDKYKLKKYIICKNNCILIFNIYHNTTNITHNQI